MNTTSLKIPDHLIPLASEELDNIGIHPDTLKTWIQKYRTASGKKLGGKIGGRWYVNVLALQEYLNEAAGDD